MNNKKVRTPIPKEVAADILYSFDRTCCICNERGKSIQIHHIDEDPSNNDYDNLSVLCLECHEETQIRGGFGRKLDATQILKYKQEWLRRVESRRQKADNLASVKIIGGEKSIETESPEFDHFEYLNNYLEVFEETKELESQRLSNYINKIADIKRTVYKYAQPDIESGITGRMNEASYEIVDFYQEILVELSTFYPFKHFEDDPKIFFSELISGKYKWHRHIRDTFGFGRNGTIVSTIVAFVVKQEVDQMIIGMVTELGQKYEIDYEKWLVRWLKSK